MEEFRDVIGYEDLFQVSDMGNIFSKRTNKILKKAISKTGYYMFSTRIGGRSGKAVCFKIHRLVAKAFIPNELSKPFVNHKDGNKLNNCLNNLEWVTPSENSLHAVATGLYKQRTKFENKKSKLTKEEVEYIKSVYKPRSKDFGTRALGRKFGVCHTTIIDVLNW